MASEEQNWYRVFKPEIDTVAFDLLDPPKRYHEGVFVETDRQAGSGTMFHVTGDVIAANGMYFEERADFIPDQPGPLHALPQIGWVRKADFISGRIGNILQALPRPTRQQGINFWKPNPTVGPYEMIWVRQDGERYEPGEERRPIFKCNEWTHQYAIPALRDAGVLCDIPELIGL